MSVDSVTTLSKRPGRRHGSLRSPVWQYMVCDRDTHVVQCTICHKTMMYTGGTTNMRYHLTAAHQMEEFVVAGPSARIFKEEGEWKYGKQRTKRGSPIRPSGKTPRSSTKRSAGTASSPMVYAVQKVLGCAPERVKTINSEMVRLFAESLLPICMVEDEGFGRFVETLEPGYLMPAKSIMEKMLITKYKEAQEKLTKVCMHKDVKNFSLMLDVWTNNLQETFMTVTMHYLSITWNRVSWALGTDRFSSKPSFSELSASLHSILDQYHLSIDNVTAVVSRTGAFEGAQIEKLGETLSCGSMSCAAGKLEQCVQNAFLLPEAEELVEDVRKMVSHLLTNDEAKNMLNKAKKERNIVMDIEDLCKGSWLVTADMIIKAVSLREVINNVRVQDEKNLPMYLNEEKWETAAQLVHSLQILKAALTVLSDKKSGSVSCLLPVVHSILQHCNSQEEDGSLLSKFLSVIAREVNEKWDLNSILPSSVMMLSALLDPRFKQLKFITEEDKLDVIDALKQLITVNTSQVQDLGVDVPSNGLSPFLCLFGEDEFNKKPENRDAEVISYLAYPPLSHEMCPLDWWGMNHDKFPELAKIARCYLAVPAATQPWQDIATGPSRNDLKRGLLEGDSAAPIIFLNKNWSILL